VNPGDLISAKRAIKAAIAGQRTAAPEYFARSLDAHFGLTI
jgi:hypothetical protein